MLGARLSRTPSDVIEFNEHVEQKGWSDGLPLIPPPTSACRRSSRPPPPIPARWSAELSPFGAACIVEIVEKVAANAVMTGTQSLPLLCAALLAMTESELDLHALNAATGSVLPALIVNGPIRHGLEIPFGAGCLGGAGGGAPLIGRALRLVMRNVAGQLIGVTSQNMFRTPGRVAGIVSGEWEEPSRGPRWPSDATHPVTPSRSSARWARSTSVTSPPRRAPRCWSSSASHSRTWARTGCLTASAFSEVLVAFNPVWAEIIGQAFPDTEEVAKRLWTHASLLLNWFPASYRKPIEDLGRVDAGGRVHLTHTPADVLAMIAAGLGGPYTAALRNWGATRAQARRIG